MCGIAGFVGGGTEEELRKMHAGISHRGPDDTGILVRDHVGLAHARLSIIDLSPMGHQPMFNAEESAAIVFNGEIFNYRELRQKLAYPFKGASDTEVILALYDKYSIDCFEKLSGQFAIAIYDFRKGQLILARDRMGEKPLYWTIQHGTLYFASELGALLKSGAVKKDIDSDSLHQYLQLDYVPTPRTIISHVYKLEPGTTLVFSKGHVTFRKFWSPPSKILDVSLSEAVKVLDTRLSSVVSRELVSDVPLGVFLSGGIDSSTIAYYAQKAHSQPMDTFSIGFNDAGFDESPFARQVAAHLGTNHHELQLSAKDALEWIPEIADVFSEPVADASVMPTMLLSKFARTKVTVALGGDGGDELFAGYPTFFAESVHGMYRKLPRVMRRSFAAFAHMLPTSHGYLSWTYGAKKFVSSDAHSPLHRHMEWLGTFDEHARERLLGRTPATPVFTQAEKFAKEYTGHDKGNALLYLYARTYLMDQVLVKVDRASMHFALETRAPFLDHAIVDYVFSLPYTMKYRGGRSKFILKELMKDKLPPGIVNRSKKGFSVPMARWLAGDLESLCREVLAPKNLKKHGLLKSAPVQKLIDEHTQHKRDNRKELWNLMMFQMWYDRWMR